jgi:hypothetical protein
MQFKSIPWWLWLIPTALLLIATARMPYGYYTVMRIVVCGFAGYLAYVAWEQEDLVSRSWAVAFGSIAILFNPIVPVYLKRATWFDIDVGVAIIFATHLIAVRLGRPSKTISTDFPQT